MPGEENLAAKFLWLAMVDRLGQAVGPMLGQAAGSFGAQGGLAVCLFLGVGLAVWLWMPAYPGAQSRDSMLVSLRAQVGNTRLAWLVAVLCGYWAIQQQMSVLIPLAAAQIGRREQVGPLFSLSAMAGLLLVLLLPRIRMEQLWSRLLLAQGVTAGSMALPVLLPGFAGIVATTVGLAVAAVLGQPAMDALVGALAPADARASAYGFAALSFGVGGAVGQVLGGWSWSLWQQGAPTLPWLLFTLIGFLTLTALYVLRKDVGRYDRLP
jgi:DHA1 family multidrug resistance protein-like MFS transporter